MVSQLVLSQFVQSPLRKPVNLNLYSYLIPKKQIAAIIKHIMYCFQNVLISARCRLGFFFFSSDIFNSFFQFLQLVKRTTRRKKIVAASRQQEFHLF
jgi:hypothetical protein